jgi:hypothetical protein
VHGGRDLDKTSNVGARNERWELALSSRNVLLSVLEAVEEGLLHDELESRIDILRSPVDALAVLCHLEAGNGDTTGVGGLAWCVPDGRILLRLALGLEDVDGLLRAAHVGALGDEARAGGDECLGFLLGDFILGRARKGDVHLDVGPWACALEVLELWKIEGRQCLALDLEVGDGTDVGWGEGLALLGDEGALGVGHGDDGGAELDGLEGSVLGDVAGAGDGDGLASEGSEASVLNHVLDIVDETVTSSLRSDERSTPGSSLSSEHTLPLVGDSTVGTEEPSDFTTGNTDISCWNIGIGTNVLGELAHEGHAELADLIVGLALWIEIGSSLTTSDVDY